jgi:hypothetical protein
MILGHLSHKGCVVLLSGDNAHLTEPTLIRRKQMKVTREQLLAWLGSDATKDTLIELLLELANREYDAETMRADIGLYSLHEGK